MAAAADAALYFVEHQHGAALGAQCAQFPEEAGFGRENAAFALDGFDEHGGHRVVDQAVEAVDVIELAEFEAVQHGAEAAWFSCRVAAAPPKVRP